MARRLISLLVLPLLFVSLAISAGPRGDASLPPRASARLGSLALRHGGHLSTAVFSPDGKMLATAAGSGDYHVRLWDPATGKLLHKLEGHKSNLFALAFSPDGKTLASGASDPSVFLCDPATGKQKGKLEARATVFALAYAPDGKVLASLESRGQSAMSQ